MKAYWEVPGPSKAPHAPCLAFSKLDGSNLRFEWSKKNSWHKFGTRHELFDATSKQWGSAIHVFNETYADDLARVFRDRKEYREVERTVVFCEYFGPSSFAGCHNFDELRRGEGRLVLFDISIYKKGFVLPKDFVEHFGHLTIAEVVYEGNFSTQFIQDVKEGKYPVNEGVVAKGVTPGKRANSNQGLWMAKVKTNQWFQELRKKSVQSPEFLEALKDNVREQSKGY